MKIALESLGVEVDRFQENDPDDWVSLSECCDTADVVLWTTTHSFDVGERLQRSALDTVRKAGKPIVGYHLDRWFGLARAAQMRTHPFFTHTDFVCTSDGDHDDEWKALGIRHEWFPPAISARHVGLAAPDHDRFPHPVVFVGSWRNYHDEHAWRFRMVANLRERYHRSATFGIYPIGGARVVGDELATLYATAEVVVGDSCLVQQGGRYWSDRIPETLGRGGILVHPWISDEGLDAHLFNYRPGDVDSMFAAIDAARAATPAERTQRRLEGIETVATGHTYEHRMERLLELLDLHGATVRRRYWSQGAAAMFLPRPETTDQVVLDETWVENVYRLRPEWVEDGVVVDVGANVGAVSVWAAKHGARRVIAIEPEWENVGALAANLEANGIGCGDDDVVLVVQVAVSGGDALGWATMSGTGGGAKVERWSGRGYDDGLSVPARPFRWIFDPLLHEQVDLLKIDIEGGEWRILTSPANVAIIGDRVRRMVVEFHDFGWHDSWDFARMVTLLAEVGKVEILGRPSAGGMLWWESYK